jgi:predicted nicotinamide N-methyase
MKPATPPQPVFIESPLTLVPDIERETVTIQHHQFLLERPARSDRLLDDPVVQAANEADDYMPYWADIWPASRMMAKVILRERFPENFSSRSVVLELGCGLGLAGLAALKRGFSVIFSDYDLTALSFAARNARLNGFTDFQTLPLDWRYPPENLRVTLLLAADLTYEIRNIDPLLALMKQVLAPDGVCWLTDPDRNPAAHLRRRLDEERFVYSTEFIRAGEPGGDRVKGTLYRIRLPGQPGLCEITGRTVPS